MIAVHSVTSGFSAGECDHIALLAANAESAPAKLVGQNTLHNLRRADLVWTDQLEGAGWIMERIIDLVRDANRVFGFDLTEFRESPQIARYDGARAGHFDWHSDIGDGVLARARKLTMVAQISDPADYDGGLLELMPSAHVVQAETARGAVTIFPSYLLHRVTPVTKGTRLSLTVWAHGPAFR